MISYASIKRTMDLVVGILLLPFVLPVLAFCGALIKVDSEGPLIFRQVRVGKDRKTFTMLKLRTMVVNAEKLGAGIYAEPNDPRFTRAGLWLRRFSLDELPQVFNVIKGDMSLVGPRPALPVIVQQYSREYDEILRMKPGITGVSQVSGRNELPRSRRLKMDALYAEQVSLWLDMKILAKTAWVVLTGSGQVNIQSREEVER